MPASDVAARLTVAEAVPLGYALLDRLARDAGHRVLAIKGPVTTGYGLRDPRDSVDVDVLVHPDDGEAFHRTLGAAGWEATAVWESPTLMPYHSREYHHRLWPIALDVHWYFPGFLADPALVFDELWRGRTTMPMAHRDVTAPGRAGAVAVAALHLLREGTIADPGPTALVQRCRDVCDAAALAELADLSAATGAAATLRPFLVALGAPTPVDRRPSTFSLHDWTLWSGSPPEVTGWLVGLGRARLAARPGLILRALWPSEQELRRRLPGLGADPADVRRARLLRLRRGARALPAAARYLWRVRRDRA